LSRAAGDWYKGDTVFPPVGKYGPSPWSDVCKVVLRAVIAEAALTCKKTKIAGKIVRSRANPNIFVGIQLFLNAFGVDGVER
jgi:hypothetical protein